MNNTTRNKYANSTAFAVEQQHTQKCPNAR